VAPHVDQNLRSKNQTKLLRSALETNPNDTQTRSLLSFGLMNEGKINEALTEARLAIQHQPDSPLALYVLSHDSGATKAKRVALLMRAITLDPGCSLYYGRLAFLQQFGSSCVFGRTAIRQSLDTAEKGLTENPADVYCLAMRAQALMNLGRLRESIATLEVLVRLNPDAKASRLILLMLYIITFKFSRLARLIRRQL
jgi:tetratricopeptide (TPR) repeat protein